MTRRARARWTCSNHDDSGVDLVKVLGSMLECRRQKKERKRVLVWLFVSKEKKSGLKHLTWSVGGMDQCH